MRRHPVNADQALWWRLRKHQLGGFRFRRQHPIGRFVGDFVCLEARLIVEVDGIQHRENVEDIIRSEALFNLGFKAIRFENDRVRSYMNAVCDEILAAAQSRMAERDSDASF